MNILFEKLPQSVNIGGVEVRINTDFRTSIMFEELIKQYDLEDEQETKEFYEEAIKLYYNDKIPNKLKGEAVEQMMWFYRCGKDLITQDTTEKPKEQIIDYEYDSELIYGDFLSQYKIDFQNIDYMHWWRFKSLFRTLDNDSKIKEAISIRATDITKVPKEMRDHYKKLKKFFKIPLPQEEAQEDDEVANILLNGGDLSQLDNK